MPTQQRVAYIMQHINENYRYLGDWRSSERGYVPFSLAEIEQRGYGDCKDLAVLLVAMLKVADVQSEIALVSRGLFAPALLIPGTSAPNHAIVRANVEGKTWWLDPTNTIFVPGRTMPDLQERWALVMESEGGIHQETIPLEPPTASIMVERSERYEHDAKAQITSSTSVAALALAQLSLADRSQGSTSFNNDLCRNVGREPLNCHVKRDELGFIIPTTYLAEVTLTDLKPLEQVAGQYIYQRDDLLIMWEQFADYLRENQQADLYLGDPSTAIYDISVNVGYEAQPFQACTIESPWFDISLQDKSSASTARYHYTVVQKIRTLRHDELRSDAFQSMVQQARDCVGQLRLAVELPNAS